MNPTKMMNRRPAFLAAVLTGCMAATAAFAADPTSQSTATPTTKSARTLPQISSDLVQVSRKIQQSGGSADALADAVKRADSAPKLVPLLKQQSVLLDEYFAAEGKSLPPSASEQMKQRNTALLYLLGDPATLDQINSVVAEGESESTVGAFSTLLLSQWIAAGKDENAQIKLIDKIENLDKSHPANTQLTRFTFMLSQYCVSSDLAERMMMIAVDEMKNPEATALKPRVALIQQFRADRDAAKKRQESIENHTLTLTGKTPDGKDFTTADWKGKVILIDFWASWCPAPRVDLPRIKKIYSDYHSKGLEIVGVSSDYKLASLTEFTAKNELPWPELFDPAAAAQQRWNPLTLGCGIRDIPTIFLVDKKGICRTVDAGNKLEDLVPALLAEK